MLTVALTAEYKTKKSKGNNFSRDDKSRAEIAEIVSEGRSNLLDVAQSIVNPTALVAQTLQTDPWVTQMWEILQTLSEPCRPWTSAHFGCRNLHSAQAVEKRWPEPRPAQPDCPVRLIVCSGSTQTLERNQGPAIWEQVVSSLHELEQGGCLVVILGECYQQSTQLLAWVLYNCFGTVEFKKPATSNVTGPEKFLVCQHFCGPQKMDFKVLDQAVSSPMSLADNCPVSWFGYVTDVQSRFTQQAEIWKRKALHVFNTIKNKDAVTIVTLCENDKSLLTFTETFIDENFLQ